MNKKTLSSIRKTRTMHLIDIENLCMVANPTLEQVIDAHRKYIETVRPGENDQFLVTVSSKTNLAAAAFGWAGAVVKCREGHDGADILLAKAILEDHLAERFDKVVLASGDGGLAPFVQHLTKRLKNVVVVSWPKSTAFAMRISGAQIRYVRPQLALAA